MSADEPLADLAASFARDNRAKGRAKKTIVVYDATIRMFGEWLAEHGQPVTVASLTRDNIRSWLADLAATRSAATVSTRHAALRRFVSFAVEEQVIDHDPMRGIRAPVIKQKPVPVLDDQELIDLLRACQGRDFESRRDEAMIRVLIDTGVRVSELAGMTIDTVDLNAEYAFVVGKGGRTRPVYFGTKTVRSLDRYLRERRKHRNANLPNFWLSQRGTLGVDAIRERLRVRSEQANLKGRVNPHRFRHTMAHDFLLNGGQERDLKKLAGWSSDIMLERYGSSAADMRAREAARRLRRGDRV